MPSQELQNLIAMLRAQPAAGPDTPVEQMRQNFEAMAAMNPLPPDVRTERVQAGGVPAEWVIPANAAEDRVLLYLHGGGYVIGSINTHRELVARIAQAAGVRGLALDYRLAPEHPFPAAVEDATSAYAWLLEQGYAPERIVIAGDSAGGGLTLATLVNARERSLPMPAAAVCLSPWVDLEGLGDSMRERADVDPIVQRDMLLRMAALYLGGADPRTPLAAPLYADLRGLPPLLIQVGTWETLYDDATRIAERAREAGVQVILEPWEEMIHVWQLFASVPEAREATERIAGFIRERLATAART